MGLDDQNLILRFRQGEEQAFLELIRRYEYPLSALIRYSVNNAEDAEDVLQETLMYAWVGLRKVRDTGNVRAWLMQVARNRCADYFRSKLRREIPSVDSELEDQLGTLSYAQSKQKEIIADVLRALEQAPEAERNAARLFYLKGFTIAEIAARHQCPEGTVKRQLFTARTFVRQALGVIPSEGTTDMNKHRVGSKAQPFPKTRPEIEITPIDTEPFVIDCREMRYWGIIPEIGQRALMADYDSVQCIKRVSEERVTRVACIHKVQGVEIELEEWWWEEGWKPVTVYFYGRVLTDKVQWLAEVNKSSEEVRLRTFLDEGFVWAYPDCRRHISSGDLFEIRPDGSLITTRKRDDFTGSGAGYFAVRIGRQSFNCLRIVGLEGPITDEGTCVTEAYITDAGRMVHMRHYCRPSAGVRSGEQTNEDVTMTVDGQTFSHFRDTITDTAIVDLISASDK